MSLENDIYTASRSIKIADMGGKDIQKFIKSLALMFGCKDFDGEELQLFAGAFKNSFGRWGRDEMNLAVKMAMGGELQVDMRAFGNVLSGDLISRLMGAYRSMKVDILQKTKGQEPEELLPVNDQYRILRDGVNRIYNEWLFNENSLLTGCYVWFPYVNQLVRDGKLTYGQTDKQMYEGIAKRNLDELRFLTASGYVSRFVNTINDDKVDSERFGYYYALLSYFEHQRQAGVNPYQ